MKVEIVILIIFIVIMTLLLISDIIVMLIVNKRLDKFNKWYEKHIDEEE